jgi:beta-1,4-mannosyl-glycoprotein beta-1,4-N-acetylglucosaminyltransferase
MSKIVDFFPYFDTTGKELLELRIKMLYDYVDEFVIAESNKTHSGIPIQRGLRETLKERGIPTDKIIIVDLDIPDDKDLVVEHIDIYNANYDQSNMNTVRAKTRERMQKDAITKALYRYSDDTVIFNSDSDEIIDPRYLRWFSDFARKFPNDMIDVPMHHFQVRADLQVYEHGVQHRWIAPFLCTKELLLRHTPCALRSRYAGINRLSITVDGSPVDWCGWHFSWMGPLENRIIKLKSFSHYQDKIGGIIANGDYGSEEMKRFAMETKFDEGSICPTGVLGSELKKYPLQNLPKEIFELPKVFEYLLPNYSLEQALAIRGGN